MTTARTSVWAREFLSGLLVGDEVATALRAEATASLVLIGEGTLARRYHDALVIHPIEVHSLDAEGCAIAGLRRLAAHTEKAHVT